MRCSDRRAIAAPWDRHPGPDDAIRAENAQADQLALACKRLGLTTFSRVASAQRVDIQHALDSGVDGVILPQIANLAHAKEATALAKSPPLGSRGVGYSRAMGYGGTGPGFFEAENRRVVVVVLQ